jgi:RimJ/RimL family protein N-acetyltransferase
MIAPHLPAGPYALRPWAVEDAPWYVAARDGVVFALTTERPELTVEEAAARMQAAIADPAAAGFAIADGEGRLVGNVGVLVERADAELSYWVAPAGRGGGAATAALEAAATWASALPGITRLRLVIHPDNPASRRVAEKAGFVAAGVIPAPHHCSSETGMVDLYVRSV